MWAAFDAWLYADTDEPDVRFTLANERTFLAWVRTSLGLLVAAMAADALHVGADTWLRLALCLALTLLAVGGVAHGWWSWARTERAIRRCDPLPRRRAPVPLVLVLAGVAGLTAALLLR